jgi:hypothetical protein
MTPDHAETKPEQTEMKRQGKRWQTRPTGSVLQTLLNLAPDFLHLHRKRNATETAKREAMKKMRTMNEYVQEAAMKRRS